MHAYMQHLADQQATNHRVQIQLNDNFYQYTLHQHRQDPNPYPWLAPEQDEGETEDDGDMEDLLDFFIGGG